MTNKNVIKEYSGGGIMEKKSINKGLFQLLGVAFLVQALLPLIGGLLFKSFETNENMSITMGNIVNNITTIHTTIILWMVTAVVIIILGVAIYHTVGHINKTMALIGLSFYIFEALLVAVGQTFVYGLVKASQLYLSSGDVGLLSLGTVLLYCRHFAGEIAMIPFGLGAIPFYYLLMKAGTIPKWLALWGLVTAPLILIGIPLSTFGVEVPFALFFPYVPFEFFTGFFILIKYRK